MTPILSFLPCAGASDASESVSTVASAISPDTTRIMLFRTMRASQRAKIDNRYDSARALEVGRPAMSRAPAGWHEVLPFGIMGQGWTGREAADGHYRFLPGIAPFSSGVAAVVGYQVIHATLRTPIPWRDGFALIDRHLRSEGRPRAALCAIELRSPAPFTFDGFDTFNSGYQALLKEWSLLVDGANPIARTNVAPVVGAPPEPSLYGFGYTVPGASARATFIVAGAGGRGDRGGGPRGI